MKFRRNESGQGTIEYILLLAILSGLLVFLSDFLLGLKLDVKITEKMKEDFQRAYQYGHPEAKGYDEGDGPELHPRASGGRNFRIFINPVER